MEILWYYLSVGVVVEILTLFVLFFVAPRIFWEPKDIPTVERIEEAQDIIRENAVEHILFVVVLWPRFLYLVMKGEG